MSSNRISLTDLDFNLIKNNLKEFLRSQSTFSDYNFDGSSLNILLDILAYNTHYNAYYLNMVANEIFLDSATLRNSVVSHAKSLGYTPISNIAAKFTIDLYITDTYSNIKTLTIPRGTSFRTNLIDNKSYNFITLSDITVEKVRDTFTFLNVELYQGTLLNYIYNFNADTNPKCIFTITNDNIDTSTILINVQKSQVDTSTETYTLASDILNVDNTSPVYFIQEGIDGKFQFYFGNDVIGKSISDGSIINANYLITDGKIEDGITNFTLTKSLGNFNYYNITNVTKISNGINKESIDSIKINSSLQYTTQNRLVTAKDYEYYLLKNYPAVDAISVWGGEDNTNTIYGKVFISLKPKNNYYISSAEKENIINNIIKPKAMITTSVEIIDPEYLYLKIYNKIYYNKIKTSLSEQRLNSLCISAVKNYINSNINKFNANFISSKVQEYLAAVDSNAITGTDVSVRLEKKITPNLNTNSSYIIKFNAPLYKGTILNRLYSSEIVIYDNYGIARNAIIEEIPESYSGISNITILNPGYNYTSIPTITITGDGYGAVATAKIVNRKIESVTITNKGIGYTKAFITVDGGGGYGASLVAILNSEFGSLRTVYFNEYAERKIINNNVGTIHYNTGEIIIDNINITKVNTSDNILRINVKSMNNIISSSKNTILTLDENDISSIVNEFIS